MQCYQKNPPTPHGQSPVPQATKNKAAILFQNKTKTNNSCRRPAHYGPISEHQTLGGSAPKARLPNQNLLGAARFSSDVSFCCFSCSLNFGRLRLLLFGAFPTSTAAQRGPQIS